MGGEWGIVAVLINENGHADAIDQNGEVERLALRGEKL